MTVGIVVQGSSNPNSKWKCYIFSGMLLGRNDGPIPMCCIIQFLRNSSRSKLCHQVFLFVGHWSGRFSSWPLISIFQSVCLSVCNKICLRYFILSLWPTLSCRLPFSYFVNKISFIPQYYYLISLQQSQYSHFLYSVSIGHCCNYKIPSYLT